MPAFTIQYQIKPKGRPWCRLWIFQGCYMGMEHTLKRDLDFHTQMLVDYGSKVKTRILDMQGKVIRKASR